MQAAILTLIGGYGLGSHVGTGDPAHAKAAEPSASRSPRNPRGYTLTSGSGCPTIGVHLTSQSAVRASTSGLHIKVTRKLVVEVGDGPLGRSGRTSAGGEIKIRTLL
jgi:hypothetical protein